jgi:5-carboxymethyl-2-hydroxymuconic-semialdehyde dehydrogenase
VIPDKIEHYVGGQHVPSADGGTFDVADAARNEVYAQAAAGGPAGRRPGSLCG